MEIVRSCEIAGMCVCEREMVNDTFSSFVRDVGLRLVDLFIKTAWYV